MNEFARPLKIAPCDTTFFDEKRQCALLIHWSNSGGGSTKGYFRCIFYLQNRGDYNLVDMRIHDINVVCDLSRRHPGTPDVAAPSEDPDEGSEYDGTRSGTEKATALAYETQTQTKSNELLAALSAVWDLVNFWPTLFLTLCHTAEMIYDILVTVDILGVVQVHNMLIASEDEQQYSDDAIASAIEIEWISVARGLIIYGLLSGGAGLLAMSLEWLKTCSWNIPQLLVAVAAWFVAFVGFIAYLVWAYDNGLQTSFESFYGCIALLVILLSSSAIKYGVINGFNLFRILMLDPVLQMMIVTLAVVAGIGEDIFSEVIQIGWNFPITVVEIMALVVCAWYTGYFLGLLLRGE